VVDEDDLKHTSGFTPKCSSLQIRDESDFGGRLSPSETWQRDGAYRRIRVHTTIPKHYEHGIFLGCGKSRGKREREMIMVMRRRKKRGQARADVPSEFGSILIPG
jgi:hypothetical protein